VLITFLQANKDIFAWKPSDMPGIPREVIEHSLNVREDVKPNNQLLRCFSATFPSIACFTDCT
jgi:hypothetical protein